MDESSRPPPVDVALPEATAAANVGTEAVAMAEDPPAAHGVGMDVEESSGDAASPAGVQGKGEGKRPAEDSAAAAAGPAAETVPVGLEYTQREGQFTSEIFKVVINGLGKHMNIPQIKKLIRATCEVDAVKVKKGPNWDYAFVTFRSTEQRDKVISMMDGMMHKQQKLGVGVAEAKKDPISDPRARKRRRVDGATDGDATKSADGTPLTPAELSARLCDKVTPLWKTPYDEQLQIKKQAINKLFRAILRDDAIRRLKWATEWDQLAADGIPTKLSDVRPSPVTEGYRNKCEFTVGMSHDGVPAVGHMLGSYEEGTLAVVPPTDCLHISATSKAIAARLEQFIAKSPLPTYNRMDHTGFWREVAVRTNSLNPAAMVTVKVQKKGNPEGVVAAELKRLHTELEAEMIRDAQGVEQGQLVSSLYVIDNTSVSGAQDATDTATLIFGSPFMRESLGGGQFDIAPQAFFQVNTLGAAVLMDVVKESCPALTDKTTLLDICCGTGTIGILLSKSVHQVIGVDICEEAIVNARANAALNQVVNCEHIAAKAEDAIFSVRLKSSEGEGAENVVAVVDPPRAGLHKDVVHHIRRHDGISHLVYISCSLGGARANIVDFCRQESKKFRGRPFKVVRVVPVDLFPHTKHCETVLVLERTST